LTIGIVGYGIYLPWCRIKLSDLAAAWGENFTAPVEKTVPFWDEDSITMAVEATQNAIKHAEIDEPEIGAIYFGTTTNPYLEKQGSSILASTINVKPKTLNMDFTGSARSSTLAMLACMDAIKSGSIKYGLVVGSDRLVARPGDAMDYLSSSGAAAVILGEERVIAEIEGTYSYATEFTERFRTEERPLPTGTIPRFEREHGFINHVATATKGLMENVGKKTEDFKYAVFTVPELTYPRRIARAIGLTPDQLNPGMVASSIGYTGSSSVLIALTAVLDKAKLGERIMMVSYSNGGSDAFSLLPTKNIEKKRQNIVEGYLKRKKYVNYTTYLAYNKIFEKVE
jgi:hydroxymethylglutaryl-CoA synthase